MFHNNRGQILLETIVTVTAGILVVGAITFATIASIRSAQFARNQSQATKLAQEGIEKIRAARDRNSAITGLPGTPVVTSWKGDATGTGSIWNYTINTTCGAGPGDCYLKFTTPQSGNSATSNDLSWITYASALPDPLLAETPTTGFTRWIILADKSGNCGSFACYSVQKVATVIVTWTDYAGSHQSRLTTILGNI